MSRHVFADSSSMISEVNSVTDLYVIDPSKSNRLIPRSSSTSDLFEIPPFDNGIPQQKAKRRVSTYRRQQVPVSNYTAGHQTMTCRSRSNPSLVPSRTSANMMLPHSASSRLHRSNTMSLSRNHPYGGRPSVPGRPTTPSSLRQSFTYNHDDGDDDTDTNNNGINKDRYKVANEIPTLPSNIENLLSSQALLRKPRKQGTQASAKMSRAEFMYKHRSMPLIFPSEDPAFVDALEYQPTVGNGNSRSILQQQQQQQQPIHQQRSLRSAASVSSGIHRRSQSLRGSNAQNYPRNSSGGRVPRYNSGNVPNRYGTLVTIDETSLLKSPGGTHGKGPMPNPKNAGVVTPGRYASSASFSGSRRVSSSLPSQILPPAIPTPPVVFGRIAHQTSSASLTELTPFQLQKQKMKSSFDFPNGEHFTPRDQFYKTDRTATLSTERRLSDGKQDSISVARTTKSDTELSKRKSRRFSSLFKRLTPSSSKSGVHIRNASTSSSSSSSGLDQLSERVSPQGSEDKFFERLQKDWEKVHLNDTPQHSSSSSSPVSSSLSSRSETSMNSFNETSFSSVTSSSNSENTSGAKKTVKFATEVYVNETFSPEEYERCIDQWKMKGGITKFVGGDTSLEIKLEINNFKKFEMDVHSDSMNFTHFLL